MFSNLSVVPNFSVVTDLTSCITNNVAGIVKKSGIEKQINNLSKNVSTVISNVEASIDGVVDDSITFIEIKQLQTKIKVLREGLKKMRDSELFEKFKKLLEIISLLKQLETIFSNAGLTCKFDSSKISKDDQMLYLRVVSTAQIIQNLGFNYNPNLFKSFDDSVDGSDDGSVDGSVNEDDENKSVDNNDLETLPTLQTVRKEWCLKKTGKQLIPKLKSIDNVNDDDNDDDDDSIVSDSDSDDDDDENHKSYSNICAVQPFAFDDEHETDAPITNYVKHIVYDDFEDIEKATEEYVQILKKITELIDFVENSKGLYKPKIYADLAEFKNCFDEKKAEKAYLLKLKKKLQNKI